MPQEITLPSGSKLLITLADVEPAEDLLSVVMAELKGVNFDLGSFNPEELSSGDLNTFKNLVCQLLGSKALRDAIYVCAAKSLYNGQRITRSSFASEEARADFLPVAWEVAKANLSPFFASLGLKSWASRLLPERIQRLGSQASQPPASGPSAS